MPTPPTASVRSGAFPLPDGLEESPKLLFDENLGPRLVSLLSSSYSGSAHLYDVGLQGAKDSSIWEYAAEHSFLLVTKDEDFHRLSVFRGFPPKVIWIRLGNCTTREVAELLEQHRASVIAFAGHADVAFLSLG